MNTQLQAFKAEFFKALAHPLRIRILELLCEGGRSVTEIQTLLESEGSAVSQQLSILRAKNIVVGVKQGKQVMYSLVDPMVADLLVITKDIFNNHLIHIISIYEDQD
ncbi:MULTISPECIES: ArsR/SmtB family transcription factor [unclassified Paenibacillus]|uniref:ArsR/SmtB family transcription factor n=1 Tax=unclassified Paenibacillus TaxID=185978 RepID=UPI000839C43F|nr:MULTISPECIES: metalloregulator ArsR/SmtB family transcription factor [unclassified Paenibacillus]NWL87534.1 ArsR family transcriptional regulator [Paenibacillus sp. 79R4]